MNATLPRFALVLFTASLGCAAVAEPPATIDGPEPVDSLEGAASGGTVGEAVTGSCTTSSVKGLSLQIIAEANCVSPGAYAEVPARPNITFGSAVFPYLEAPARDRLVAALDASPSTKMTVNSMLRTIAQQYMLYRWYQTGRCGVGLAASPGFSNHETGLAMDVSEYSAWKSKLSAKGFAWFGSGDPVHFDYVGAGAVDHRSLDVKAFQRLWNANHPEDPIGADGSFGPQTESRMKKAPASGFAKGASCGGQAATCDAVFKDICGSPFEADIEWLAAEGLTSGCDPVKKLYCPNDAVTRGQMAYFLATALGLPAGPDAFDDDDGSPFEPAINAIAKAGITTGCDEAGTKFCPEEALDRGQMAAFLTRAFGLPDGPDVFVDDEGSPYEAAINAIAKAGITSGCDAAKKLYCPGDIVARGQMASFLHRAL